MKTGVAGHFEWLWGERPVFGDFGSGMLCIFRLKHNYPNTRTEHEKYKRVYIGPHMNSSKRKSQANKTEHPCPAELGYHHIFRKITVAY